jgi:hypothetical protein
MVHYVVRHEHADAHRVFATETHNLLSAYGSMYPSAYATSCTRSMGWLRQAGQRRNPNRYAAEYPFLPVTYGG